MGLGEVIGNAVDSGFGTSSGSNLQQFLSKFSSPQGKFVDTLDPLATFDVTIAFFPCSPLDKTAKSTAGQRIVDSLGASLTGAVKNLADNLTGGLVSSIVNRNASVKKDHDSFEYVGEHTFIEYLAKANMLVSGDGWNSDNFFQALSPSPGGPLTIQLGYYAQSITVPMLRVMDGGRVQTMLGEFNVAGTCVVPDSNFLNMSILNTKLPLHERLFYPWMREVTMPYWSYSTQPYTTATITIDFSKHMDIQYVFTGCRPTQISTIQPTQDPTSAAITREVQFTFDFMFVTSKTSPVMEPPLSKLLGVGKTLFNSATKMISTP